MGLFDFLKKKKNTAQENAVSNVKEEGRKEAVINSDESGNTDTETIETIEKVVEPVKVEPVVAEEPTEVEPEVKEEPVKVEPVVEEKPVKVEPEVKEEPVKVEPVVEEKPVEVEPELKEELVETEPVVEEEPIEAEPEVEESVQEKKVGFFAKIKSGLSKTRDNILSSVDNVLKSFVKIDEDLFEELEEALIMADIGVETSLYIIEKLREKVKDERVTDPSEVKGLLVNVISEILEPLNMPSPTVILVIGVNGVGKTTTIGKLAHNYLTEGKSVLLAAADTFRAAAIDQLQIWGDRNNCEVIKHQENSDPAAVVFDAVNAAKARKTDILICDTAGRLHNKKNLMEELRKIAKVIDREYPEAHTEVFLVLDATTGQNAIQQAKLFKEVANITGLVLTKLDGTAKGGIVLAIKHDMNIPVRYIGVGEQINDLQPFNSKDFSKALFDEE